jgi:uncharacterized protein YndB with AHSA1/START domain
MTESRRTVTVTHRFAASAKRVFDAWLDPATAGRWLFSTPGGTMVRVDIDPRVGGAFCFTDRRDGQDIDHVGNYLEIDRPKRLVFTFAVTGFLHMPTRVSIDIVPDGTGCVLTLTHDDVLDDYAERTQAGWSKLLDGLAATLPS